MSGLVGTAAAARKRAAAVHAAINNAFARGVASVYRDNYVFSKTEWDSMLEQLTTMLVLDDPDWPFDSFDRGWNQAAERAIDIITNRVSLSGRIGAMDNQETHDAGDKHE